jgi:hypothetical protein
MFKAHIECNKAYRSFVEKEITENGGKITGIVNNPRQTVMISVDFISEEYCDFIVYRMVEYEIIDDNFKNFLKKICKEFTDLVEKIPDEYSKHFNDYFYNKKEIYDGFAS